VESSSPLPTKASGLASHLVGIGIMVLFVLVAGWLILNKEYVVDQLAVWQYQPSSEVKSIASRASLTDQGRFYFYASQPEVDEASSFNDQCKKQEEQSAILGCYTVRRIYIYDVTNEQLDGIKEVTAAHEMLHAAWDRLSNSEKAHLSSLLEAAYTRVVTDELKERMAYYDRTQPGERDNELHSILGTEFGGLSGELEKYYSQYFSNRAQVVAYHQKYEKVFNDLDDRIKALQAELTQLDTTVKQRLAAYNSQRTQIEQTNESLNARARTLDRSSAADVNAYNAQVNQFNASVAALKADYAAVTELIAVYNQKVIEYNSVAFSRSSLQKSIDSSQAPVAPAI